LYAGLWAALTRWFLVPTGPPALPIESGEPIDARRPAEGFLRYLKFKFWIALLGADIVVVAAWLAFTFRESLLGGALLAPFVLVAVVLPDVVAYVAIHLRYDATWYVVSARSLRIRRGLWVMHETTITFENVQNVRLEQGPLQRYFGIADVIVETAGGGGKRERFDSDTGHEGVIEGVADAQALRDKILALTMRSKEAGLGDERHEPVHRPASRWSREELEALREIRDSIAVLSRPTS
jgi:membrane protein YdbS with pleckstrin-like domain